MYAPCVYDSDVMTNTLLLSVLLSGSPMRLGLGCHATAGTVGYVHVPAKGLNN